MTPPSQSPKPALRKGILGDMGITHTSGELTIVGAEENDEPAFVPSSFPLSCPHIEQAAEAESSEVDRKSLTSGATYLSPQYTDKGENNS